MAEGPYIPEEQTADWISLAIRDFFRAAGYTVFTYKVTQHLERDLPADRIFLDPGSWKIFGFQYKTLYHNGEDRWPIDQVQHDDLSDLPWIYYCFSELKNPIEHATALHQARIYRTTFSYRPAVLAKDRSPRAYSWAEFYKRLQACSVGRRLWPKLEFERLLKQVEGGARQRQMKQLYEVLLAEVDKRILVAAEALPSARVS